MKNFLNYLKKKKKGCTEEEYEKEYETAQEYYDKYSEYKIKSNKIKTSLISSTHQVPSDVRVNSTVTSEVVPSTKQKLPEIELFKFDGDPRNWLTF